MYYETPFRYSDDLIELYNNYISSNGRSDKQFIAMDKFDDYYEGWRHSEVIDLLSENFDIDDDYFRDCNDYGKITSWEESDVFKQIEDEVETSEEFLELFLYSIDLYDFGTNDLLQIENDCENAGLDDWINQIDEIIAEYDEEED